MDLPNPPWKTIVIAAIANPHVRFLLAIVLIKIYFPTLLPWASNDAYGTTILSLVYPAVWTVGLLHRWHRRRVEGEEENVVQATRGGQNGATSEEHASRLSVPKNPPTESRVPRLTQRTPRIDNATVNGCKSPTTQRFLSIVTPPALRRSRDRSSLELARRRRRQRTRNERSNRSTAGAGNEEEEEESEALAVFAEESRWILQYWTVHEIIASIGRIIHLTPFLGRLTKTQLSKCFAMIGSANEMKFLFFIWMLFVPTSAFTEKLAEKKTEEVNAYEGTGTDGTENNNREDERGDILELIYGHSSPVFISAYKSVSNTIPPATWSVLVDKIGRVLDVIVLLKILSDVGKEQITGFLCASGPLLPPAVTLLLPRFITEYGVLYVRSVVPIAKSIQATNNLKKQSVILETMLSPMMECLQYWVLHVMVLMTLGWVDPILWWIPLSIHATFLLWCYLQCPSTISSWYEIFTEELQTLGLLPRYDGRQFEMVDMRNARTVQVLRTLASSLPSATDDSEEGSMVGASETLQDVIVGDDLAGKVASDEESINTLTCKSGRRTPNAVIVDASSLNDERAGSQCALSMDFNLESEETANSSCDSSPGERHVHKSSIDNANREDFPMSTSDRNTVKRPRRSQRARNGVKSSSTKIIRARKTRSKLADKNAGKNVAFSSTSRNSSPVSLGKDDENKENGINGKPNLRRRKHAALSASATLSGAGGVDKLSSSRKGRRATLG